MIKSKKHIGVYSNELQSGDKAYDITYKDDNKKNQHLKTGLHSAGVREAYCKVKRDEILSPDNGADAVRGLGL